MVEMVWLTWMVCVMCWFFSGLCFWTVMIEFLLLMLYMFGCALLAWCYCIVENWICLVIVMSGLLCVLQWCWHACYELMQMYCEWSCLIEYLWIISYRSEFAILFVWLIVAALVAGCLWMASCFDVLWSWSCGRPASEVCTKWPIWLPWLMVFNWCA